MTVNYTPIEKGNQQPAMYQRILPGFAELRHPWVALLTHHTREGLPSASEVIFPPPVPCTPQSWEHVALRPDGKDGRDVLEWLDFPGWTKHHLVQRHAETNDWRGTFFREIVSGMYSLDRQLSMKEWLSDSECIAGMNLVTIGLNFVTVIPRYCQILRWRGASGENVLTDSRGERIKAEWTVGSVNLYKARFSISLFYHGSGASGHWTVAIWDSKNAELYHYDALETSRRQRAEAVALAWEQYLEEQGIKQRFLFVVPPQRAQLNWECGLLAIVNVHNFFRPRAAVARVRWSNMGKECAHVVGSWDGGGWTIDQLIFVLRSQIYAFFGQPLNVPLNPRHPFVLGHPPEYLIERIRGGELVWIGGSEKILTIETAEELRREALLWEERSKTAGALVIASTPGRERAISDKIVEQFLRAPTDKEALALVPSDVARMGRAYDPYSKAAAGRGFEWPFRPIISTARADFHQGDSLKPPTLRECVGTT